MRSKLRTILRVLAVTMLVFAIVPERESQSAGNPKTLMISCPSAPKCPPNDLVAFWNFQETSGPVLHDVMAGTHDGTYGGGVTFAQPGPLYLNPSNHSVQLDGSSGYASIPDSSELFSSKFSFEIWVNPTALPASNARIFEKGGYNIGGGVGIEYWGYIRIVFWDSTGKGWSANFTSDSSIPLGQWTYLVVTFDGTNVLLYVNGSMQSTKPTATLVTNTAPLTVGRAAVGGYYFNGRISEMTYFDSVLTAGQIKNHYTQAGY